MDRFFYKVEVFQTPSAGRWVLQQCVVARCRCCGVAVSNPISGEVGAAALGGFPLAPSTSTSFKPHQRGGGCCSGGSSFPSPLPGHKVSNPISGEVGAAAKISLLGLDIAEIVSNPISGEVGAAASSEDRVGQRLGSVSNPNSGEVGAAAPSRATTPAILLAVSNPISGEVGAAARFERAHRTRRSDEFQTLSAGRWVLQHALGLKNWDTNNPGFKPHQRGSGCCSAGHRQPRSGPQERFKPHQRGSGCCSPG